MSAAQTTPGSGKNLSVQLDRMELVRRVWPARTGQAVVTVLMTVVVLYAIELANVIVFSNQLTEHGIVPRKLSGLDGILLSPLLHANWSHLLGNTVPLMVFGFLMMSGGLSQWLLATAIIWLTSGIGVWLFGAGLTVGSSGVIFGWLAFLLVRGFVTRSMRQLVTGVILFAYWGSTLIGLLPGNPGISWQAHLFGAVGGVIAVFVWAGVNWNALDVKRPGVAKVGS